jgi:hypothetical protein
MVASAMSRGHASGDSIPAVLDHSLRLEAFASSDDPGRHPHPVSTSLAATEKVEVAEIRK